MPAEHKRVASNAVIVLVAFAMLFGAMIPMAAGSAVTPGATVASNGSAVHSGPAVACGQSPVPLNSTASYAVLAATTVTSTGATVLTGDLGLSPGTSVTGFPPGKVIGTQNVTTPGAAKAEENLTSAYNNAAGRVNCPVAVAGNIGGETLTPGLYKSTSSLAISSGDLTLSGGGNPNGVFVFQIATTFTTTSSRTVILSDGARAGNVYWQVGSSATIGTSSVMQGTVMAHDSVSMLTGSVLNGRAMAEIGEVSLAGATITVPKTTTVTTYPVTFTETGLPASTSWSVTFAAVLASSSTTTIVFTAANGTFPYGITLAGYIANPTSGNVTVNGAAAGKSVKFAAGAAGSFDVNFTESGLASGTNWSVTFNGVMKNSTAATIEFTSVKSGTYTYTVATASNFTANPNASTLTVNGTGASQGIAFSPIGGGGGGGGSSSSGISPWEWFFIAVVVIGVAAGIALAIARSREGKKKAP
jgi:ice-binding like protein